MTPENPEELHFVLDLRGRRLYPPGAFDPGSAIGQAWAAYTAAEQAIAQTEAAVLSAEQELAELRGFVANATPATNIRQYGEARDRADLLERTLPGLRKARDTAAREGEQVSSAFNTRYGQYSGTVRSWNTIVAKGLDWNENPAEYFSWWAHAIRVLPAQIDAYETQLRVEVAPDLADAAAAAVVQQDAQREQARRDRQPPPVLPPASNTRTGT
jgi:hypothetical protein